MKDVILLQFRQSTKPFSQAILRNFSNSVGHIFMELDYRL